MEAEQAREAEQLVRRLEREGGLDLEAAEFFIRRAMLAAGARVLEQLLHSVGCGRRGAPLLCARLHPPVAMRSLGVRAKTLRTILGPVRWARTLWRCDSCGALRYPGDEALGVVGTRFSPGARRLMAQAGARESFAQASADLALYADLQADAKDIERTTHATGQVVEGWMAKQATQARLHPPQERPAILYVCYDGTGVPMRRAELAGTQGKGADGRARTREVKLGCVFTQTTVDEEGRPLRDEASTSYVGAIQSSADFGHQLHAEALRRGLATAGRVVLITDGAAYNQSIAQEHFPGALHILDLFHAREHLAEFLRDIARLALGGPEHAQLRALLDAGQIDKLVAQMRAQLPASGPRRRAGQTAIAYFTAHAAAMRYEQFRAQGLFVGSGVIEAGCRTVIAQRLKRSGMFWSADGANALIALRCCLASGRFEQFWEDSAA